MALRTVILLLAFLGAVVVADEVVTTSTVNVVDSTNSTAGTFTNSLDVDVVVVDGESLDAIAAEDAVEFAPDVDVGEVELEDDEGEDADAVVDAADVEPQVEPGNDEAEALSRSAHPLARILTSRSSKRCWSTKSCKKFYKKPGCCKKTCVNLASDNKNCGKCGKCCNTRNGYRCTSGKCRIPTHGSTSSCGRNKRCANGYSCCKGRCAKLGSDNKNCGRCGRSCKQGYSCKSGKCQKSKPTTALCGKNKKCVNGYTCCKEKCVNLQNNHGHCGQCDKGCDTKNGFRCKSGKCVKPTPPSPPPASECGDYKKCKSGQSCCKGKCVSLSSDNTNCGMCHKQCDPTKGYSCKSGKCVKKPTSSECGNTKCKPGQTCCHGKCVSLTSDSRNCGQCGKACDGKKGYCCKSGKCVKGTPTPSQCGKDKKCRGGETCCNGTCKSVKHDDRNCGKCGKSCGYAKKCCHGYCINVFGSDKNHCGECGKKCPTSCKLGMCGYGQ